MIISSEDQRREGQKPFDAHAVNDLPPVKATKSQRVIIIFLYIITLSIYYWVVHIGKINNLNRMENRINTSASGIEIQLQKRFDTLTKLVDAVKGQVEFNKEVYENIAKYRSNYDGLTSNALTTKNNSINKIQAGLTMAFENYPSLGADESIRKLMNESAMIEKEIAAARRLYNNDVEQYNTAIYNFPLCAILEKKGYKGLNLFKADERVKEDVKINF